MESNQPIYRAPKIPNLNRKIISSSVLSGAPKLKVTRIGMPISKIGIGANQRKIVVGQSPVAPESLLSIANAVDSIAGGLKRVTEMFVREGEVEQKEQKEREKREKREEENKRRKAKESGLEKGIANFLLSPVKAVAGKTQGILSSLMEFFTLLFVGWLTDKGLSAIKMNAEGNTKGLEELRNTVLKNLAIVGGTLAALNTGFFGIAGLIAGIAGGILAWLGKNTIGKLFDRLRGVKKPPTPTPTPNAPGVTPTTTPQVGQRISVLGPDGKPLIANGKPVTSPVVHYEPRTGMVDGVRKNLPPRAITAFEIAKNPNATASQVESLMKYELQQAGYTRGAAKFNMSQFKSQLVLKYGVKDAENMITRGAGIRFPGAEATPTRAPSIPSSRAAMTAEVFGESATSTAKTGFRLPKFRLPKVSAASLLKGGATLGLSVLGSLGVDALGEYVGDSIIQSQIDKINKLSPSERQKAIEKLKARIQKEKEYQQTPAHGAERVTAMGGETTSEKLTKQLSQVLAGVSKPIEPKQFMGPGGSPSGSGQGQFQRKIEAPVGELTPSADITPIPTAPFIPQQEIEPTPNIIYKKVSNGQQNQGAPLKSGSATDVPLISSSNPDNFYTLYSQVNYNVVM